MLTLSLPLFCSSQSDDREAERRASAFRRETRDLESLARKTDYVLNGIMEKAYRNLRDKGFYDEADGIRGEWRALHRGRIASRDIGDFPGVFNFIDRTYFKLEKLLGYEVAHALRLDDLLTLNRFNEVLDPCIHGEKEFTAVFCGDKHVNPHNPHPHRGWLPVLSFWSTELSCDITSVGLLSWFCGPISILVEWDVDKYDAPWLAPHIFAGACE